MSGAVKSNSFTTEVYQATDIDTSDVQDVDSWNRINMGGYLQDQWNADDMQAYSKAGLFNFDLSTFMADCDISLYCNEAEYDLLYDGLAIGQVWYIDSASSLKSKGAAWISNDYQVYTCFEKTGGCTGLQMHVNNGNSYGHYLMSARYNGTFAVDQPTNPAGLS